MPDLKTKTPISDRDESHGSRGTTLILRTSRLGLVRSAHGMTTIILFR
jgi:hypothetical protein